MERLNDYRMTLMFVALAAAIVFSGGSAKADFVWTQKTDMPTPRWGHTSAMVNDKIYLIGGAPSQPVSAYLPTVEEYDPATDTWTTKADMPTARFGLSTCVVNGRIYAIGGDDFVSMGSPAVEEYDPATDVWTRKADMPTPRWGLSTCTFNGRIYAVGGYPPDAYVGLTTLEVYDPETDTWIRKADMPLGVALLNALVVRGRIYALGGRPDLKARAYVQEYDPATDTWRRKADMLVATSQMASGLLGDRIVVIGGWEWSLNNPYRTLQIYDPQTNMWTREADVPFLRACGSANVVNNRIYVIGGTDRPHPCLAMPTVYEFGPLLDFNGDGMVDIEDLVILIESWGTDNPLCDIAPLLHGDGIVDVLDLEVLMNSWGQVVDDPTLIAHYALDEAEGFIGADSAGENNTTLSGQPLWEPEGGRVGGALQFDGVDDYLITPFILNPADGPFSVFAWAKGGAPAQVVLSQADGTNWLCTDSVQGCLMTELKTRGRVSVGPLLSRTAITDATWHRIGLVWDGSHRHLCVDGAEVAKDAAPLSGLEGEEGGLYLGAGSTLAPGTFFSGLIDDVRIYDRAVSP